MQGMFRDSNFNGNIASWEVSRVASFSNMFRLSSFNTDIGAWDVANATDFSFMFYNSDFNQNIDAWSPNSAETMESMFELARFYNQNLCAWGAHFETVLDNVGNMFLDSGCPNTGNPMLAATPVSPLCYTCHPAFTTKSELQAEIDSWLNGPGVSVRIQRNFLSSPRSASMHLTMLLVFQ